jgi:hypothetical protein
MVVKDRSTDVIVGAFDIPIEKQGQKATIAMIMTDYTVRGSRV